MKKIIVFLVCFVLSCDPVPPTLKKETLETSEGTEVNYYLNRPDYATIKQVVYEIEDTYKGEYPVSVTVDAYAITFSVKSPHSSVKKPYSAEE